MNVDFHPDFHDTPIMIKIPFRAEGGFDADQTGILAQGIAQRHRPRSVEIPVFSRASECIPG
ncbi:MAG: hypothetical protein EOR61_01300 [Mesorhizobium sp.]|nr:MAG: hypothetical protein EOR61_01300 [Mesorhizobium sp.]TIP54126.1 MAG: hypothetical protein E5X69_00935 [Mesorhizobium sp.]